MKLETNRLILRDWALTDIDDLAEGLTKADLLAFFRSNQVKYNPTHDKLCLPIINRIYKKMVNGIRFEHIKVCDNLLIDGRHRYVRL